MHPDVPSGSRGAAFRLAAPLHVVGESRVECPTCHEDFRWERRPLYGVATQRCKCGVKPIPRVYAVRLVTTPVAGSHPCVVCGSGFERPKGSRAAVCSTSCKRERAKRQKRESSQRRKSGVPVSAPCERTCRDCQTPYRSRSGIETSGRCQRCAKREWMRQYDAKRRRPQCSACGAKRSTIKLVDGQCAHCRRGQSYRARRLHLIAERRQNAA